jgi:hypothetical protein
MANKKETNKGAMTQENQKNELQTIDQMSMARQIAKKLSLKLTDVISVVEEEQKLTMEYVKMGYKVVKKNYLTLEGKKTLGKKDWVSPLTGKKYVLEPSIRVLVRVGAGFKQFVSQKQMPEKLCRFVSGGGELAFKVQEKK